MTTNMKCEHGKYAGLCPQCKAKRLAARDPSHTRIEPRTIEEGSSDEYFVYENWTADGHKAKVHRGDCSHCNGGRGKDPDASDRNGQWRGPFATRAEAAEQAKSLTRNASDCAFCAGG